jgi:hypothetical protein
MMPCKTPIVCVCLFLLATVPAYCQRGTIGIDAGQTSDKFGGLARDTALTADLNAQFIVLHSKEKEGSPDVVAGAEVRFPSDTNNHPYEFAFYGGLHFPFGRHFSGGFHVQIHRIYMPASSAPGPILNRDNLQLLELPVVLEYKFSTAPRHAFLQVQGAPEFTPHYKAPSGGASPLPTPQFDHGYTLQGSVGYMFPKWYLKGTYQSRYFKFNPDLGNPSGYYNWRSDAVTGGIGVVF